MRKPFLSIFLFVLLPLMAMAETVEINGIYYNLIEKAKVAEVTKNPKGYAGETVIPEKVNHEGILYSVTSIGNQAFQFSNQTSVTIPNSVTSIGDAAFNMSHVTSVTIPSSVTKIGNYAFAACTNLTSVTIPNGMTKIGDGIFSECSGLMSITIPNSVTEIGNQAFAGCGGLTSVTIPNSVTRIGNFAFAGCSNLTSVTIPNSLTKIGNGAFDGCSGLTSVTIPNGVTSIEDYTFRDCSRLTSVMIPNSLTKIGNETFDGCSGLTSVTIPNGVTSIGHGAFRDCSGLTSIKIGSSINYIDTQAFANCQKLTDITCLAETVPKTNSDVFEKSYPEYMTLHVPTASINSYKATVPWSSFGKIVTIEGGEVATPKCATPTISYSDGTLKFSSDTEGAEFVSDITDTDIKKHYDANITLTAAYNISVYATKTGYENSDIAKSTLYWVKANGSIETNINSAKMRAVVVSSNDGIVTISGLDNDERVSFYTVDGKMVGRKKAINGVVSMAVKSDEVVIAKFGDSSVKMIVK